jgi:hypothetical protein
MCCIYCTPQIFMCATYLWGSWQPHCPIALPVLNGPVAENACCRPPMCYMAATKDIAIDAVFLYAVY